MSGSTDSMRRVRLSVAMIVRNEQKVLGESLRSVRSIADEVVILDTGSSDGTVALAEQTGARCIRANWNDDFAAARNLLYRQLTGEWVLWLDAGETLEAASASELRTWLDRQAKGENVYMMLVRSPSPVPGASAEQIAQPRLMPCNPGLRFEGRIRETIEPSVLELGMKFAAAPGIIRRHARHQRSEVKARRAECDLRIAQLEIDAGAAPRPRVLIARGEALADLGQNTAARQAFLAAIEAAEHGSTEMLEAYYGLLTAEDASSSGLVRQMTTCLEALEIFPLDAQLHLAMGNYLQARGEFDLAARSFRSAMEHGQLNLEVWHLAEVAEVAASCLSLILQMQNKDQDALELLSEAMQRYPDSPRLCRRAIDLHIKLGQVDKAIRAAEGLPHEMLSKVALADTIRGACKAVAKDWVAALGYLQAAYATGCEDPLCLRWLTVTLLSNGRRDEAQGVLRKWLQREPDNAEALAYREAIEEPPATNWTETETAGATGWLRIDPAAAQLDVYAPHWPTIVQVTTQDDEV
ncbi:MAG: glycosyltransferase [Pirellulales bacterium]|nr:glycosyltransferase [Pirellulales bacterium]